MDTITIDILLNIALVAEEPIPMINKQMHDAVVQYLYAYTDEYAPLTYAIRNYCKSKIDSYAVFADLCKRADIQYPHWMLPTLLQAGKGSALKYMLEKCPNLDDLQQKVCQYIRCGDAPLKLKARLLMALGPKVAKRRLHCMNTYEGVYNEYPDGPICRAKYFRRLLNSDYDAILRLLRYSPYLIDIEKYLDIVLEST